MQNWIIGLILPSFLFINLANAQYCTNDDRFTEVEFFTDSHITTTMDVTYAWGVTDYLGNCQDLQMNIYAPSDANETLAERPFILLMHGGGFLTGTRNALNRMSNEFAKRGFVAATISYRLGWDTSNSDNQIPAVYRAQQDASAALRFIVQRADEYKIDTDWMFIGGSSAGSVTALNVVYSSTEDLNAFVPGITAQLGALNSSGNGLRNKYDIKGIFNNWGMVPELSVTTEELIPMVAFHGVLDTTTPINDSPGGNGGYIGSFFIHQRLEAAGVCSDLTVDSTAFHGLLRSPEGEALRVGRASCFFKSQFCNDCSTVVLIDSIPADCSTDMMNNINSTPTKSSPTLENGSGNNKKVYFNSIRNLLNFQGNLEDYHIEMTRTNGEVYKIEKELLAANQLDVSTFKTGLYYIELMDRWTNESEIETIFIE